MKFGKMLAISLFAMALTTAVFADRVAVDYDHAVNFKQVKTYSWSKIRTANSIWDERVKDAIDKELTAKGWTRVPSTETVVEGVVLRLRRLPFISSTTPSTTVSVAGAGAAALESRLLRLTTTRLAR